jgi:hypothetical protein
MTYGLLVNTNNQSSTLERTPMVSSQRTVGTAESLCDQAVLLSFLREKSRTGPPLADSDLFGKVR